MKRKWTKIAALVLLVGFAFTATAVAGEQSITGVVEETDQGIVISADDGDSYLVKGKNLAGKLWVFTSRGVYEQAEKGGLIKIIEDAGGRVYRDTCMVVAPLHEMGWHGVGTNSFKGGHYSVAHGFDTELTTVDKLVKEASE